MRKKDFDVIIVGAGPSGLAAGFVLAKAGVNTLIIERGKFPGSKNVMGGIFYRKAMDDLIPEFYKEAPVERRIIEQNLWFMDNESHLGVSFRSQKYTKEPFNSFSVFRAKFDRWFAKKVEEVGALIINETVVQELIVENSKVVGVKTDRPKGDLYADVVIGSDGVNSLLAKQLGLRKNIEPNIVALAVKEVIGLDKEKINDRFGLENDKDGVAYEMTGPFLGGMEGMGWLYTNSNSISIGVGVVIEDLIKHKTNPNDLLEKMKSHPSVAPLIYGGQIKEYLAHMIPEGGYYATPKIYTDGFMTTGDAIMFVNNVNREGSNLAIESGKLAAETYLEAKQTGDFSAKSLSKYRDKVRNSFACKDLKMYRNMPKLLEKRRYFLTEYPQFFIDSLYNWFNVDGISKPDKLKRIKREFVNKFGYIRTAKDLYAIWRDFVR